MVGLRQMFEGMCHRQVESEIPHVLPYKSQIVNSKL